MRRGTSRGFTLLEVLGAVAIIGVAFTLLARANIEALRAEGTARRQLAASLVADRSLAELEAGVLAGAPPAVGRRDQEVDGFAVAIDVQPMDFVLPPLPEGVVSGFEATTPANTLLPDARSGRETTPLRHVRIEVTWEDLGGPRSVLRETFVFDTSAVEATLTSLAGPAGGDAQ